MRGGSPKKGLVMEIANLTTEDLKHLRVLTDWAESGVDKYGLEEDPEIIAALLHWGPVVNPDFDYPRFLGITE